MSTLIQHVSVIYHDRIEPNCYVLFEACIQEIGSMAQVPACDHVIDGTGLLLSPGFIDIHTHGCGGKDTMDGEAAVRHMASLVVRGGTTSFLPTTVAATPADLHAALTGVRAVQTQASKGANVLGAHVEGPFLAAPYKGAHEEALLLNPNYAIIEPFADVVRVVTVAPELDGAEAFIRACAAQGIICSLGHSGATFEQCEAALSWGAKSFTHCYNAMSPLRHREPGVVGAALSSPQAYTEMITDNIHVHPAAQRVAFAAKGAARLVLITDALRPCMVGDGPFMLGNLAGNVSNGRATLMDGTLAGSILTLNVGVRHLIENTGCALYEAVQSVTLTPATLLGVASRKGRICVGADADLTLLTPECNVKATFVGGALVYHD